MIKAGLMFWFAKETITRQTREMSLPNHFLLFPSVSSFCLFSFGLFLCPHLSHSISLMFSFFLSVPLSGQIFFCLCVSCSASLCKSMVFYSSKIITLFLDILATPTLFCELITKQIVFRSESPNALLSYILDPIDGDYLLVYLSSWRVVVAFNLGSGTRLTLQSSNTVTAGNWVEVLFSRIERAG